MKYEIEIPDGYEVEEVSRLPEYNPHADQFMLNVYLRRVPAPPAPLVNVPLPRGLVERATDRLTADDFDVLAAAARAALAAEEPDTCVHGEISGFHCEACNDGMVNVPMPRWIVEDWAKTLGQWTGTPARQTATACKAALDAEQPAAEPAAECRCGPCEAVIGQAGQKYEQCGDPRSNDIHTQRLLGGIVTAGHNWQGDSSACPLHGCTCAPCVGHDRNQEACAATNPNCPLHGEVN